MKIFFKILFLVVGFNISYSQSPTCDQASAMCSGQGGPYNNTNTNTQDGNQTGYGPITGCGGSGSQGNNGSLATTPRPAWFYYTIGQTGPIELNLQQFDASNNPIDVDFALWGPFSSNNLGNICNSLSGIDIDGNPANDYTGPCNLVDASYDPSANETIHIPNAQVGEVYMLLVTNFRGAAGTYTINQTNAGSPGAGQVSCDVVCGITLGPDQLYCSSTISQYTLTAQFIQAPTSTGSPVYSWYLYNGTSYVLQTTTTVNTYTTSVEGFWKVSVVRPGCSDVAEDELELRFDSPPNPNAPSNLSAPVGDCQHTFDLTSIETDLTAPVLPSNYVIRYYTDENDCFIGNANYITNPSAFSVTTTTTIYVRIENIGNAICADANQYFDLVIQCDPATCQLNLTSAAATTNQNICFGNAIQAITYGFGGTATNLTVTGLPTGLVTNINAGVLTISGTPTQTGTFNYTVTTEGCATNSSLQGTLTINASPSVSGLTAITPVCNGSDAVFTITGTPGALVTYSINGGLDQTVTILASGQADVTVTAPASNVTLVLSKVSLSGCDVTLSNSQTVEVRMIPDVTSITTTTPICSGSDAVFTINGTPNATVTYALNGGATTTTILNAAGIGTVTVTNAQANQQIAVTLIEINGCSRVEALTETIVVNVTPVITSLTSNNPICIGSNAVFTISGTAGAAVTYSINGGLDQTVTIPASGQATITENAPASNVVMTLSVVNLNSCFTNLSNSATVEVKAVPSVTSLTSNTPICSGSSAIFTINGSANTTVTYAVNGGAPTTTTVDASGVGTITLTNTTANVTVSLSLIDNGGCSTLLSNTESVSVLALPNVTGLTANSPICAGSDAVFTITGTPNTTVSYSINGGTSTTINLDGTGSNTLTITNATANQILQLSNIYDGSCNNAVANSATVVVNQIPNTPTITPQSNTFCIGDVLVFNVTGGSNEVVMYTIDNGANQTLNLNATGTGVITVTNPAADIVEINLVEIINGACSKNINVTTSAEVISCTIPKGVSPNGDGINDTWDLTGYNVKQVEIFNRYGTKVFSKTNYVDEWHGQSDNNNELPDGTYYYVVEYNDSPVKTGWVYINREQ